METELERETSNMNTKLFTTHFILLSKDIKVFKNFAMKEIKIYDENVGISNILEKEKRKKKKNRNLKHCVMDTKLPTAFLY